MADCLHCGLPVPDKSAGGNEFCCSGCEAAYGMVQGLGLESYYRRRCIDPDVRPMRPDEEKTVFDFSSYIKTEDDGTAALHLMIEGMQCAACVWLIESALARQTGVTHARINMTTRRLVLKWHPKQIDAATLVGIIGKLGYKAAPFDPMVLGAETKAYEKNLLISMAVAGFAAGNVMLFSVSVWAGYFQGMGPATRDLMHWLSALITLPAVAYAGVPFYRSAITALKARRTNMDVPISLAVLLASGMSLLETVRGGEHVYFDSAITLLFFLLVGRYLDSRARGRARSMGEHLLALSATAVTVLNDDGSHYVVPPGKVSPGMRVLVSAGERISVDGKVIDGISDIDTQLINGESTPDIAKPDTQVFAGTINLTSPLSILVTAVGEDTLLAEILRLMEAAEEGRARYVAIADRVSALYAPVVHGLAMVAFIGWWLFAGVPWQQALMIAVAVLIITCPCALALAVPAVQVVASGRFLRRGMLLKSGTALERLAEVDYVVFDKTGTLTMGMPEISNQSEISKSDIMFAATIAAHSKHPLSRAIMRAAGDGIVLAKNVEEVPGSGLLCKTEDGEIRLGRRDWCGVEDHPPARGPELWLMRPSHPPLCFTFVDRLRIDGAKVIDDLQQMGLGVELLSGDREETVARVAKELSIKSWSAGLKPTDKVARLAEIANSGRRVLMVGDGINDAPALAGAHVSLSPSSAADIS
ncbi:MAG: heavy metal translocating P-type ATPase metal-binding domain-containing protein, partial [Rhodospirillaceae bacterium]|nr:heavy metal translocating P-type ATPase metal-binding domain-containing protein [Rhodospirillaceae bacterium]